MRPKGYVPRRAIRRSTGWRLELVMTRRRPKRKVAEPLGPLMPAGQVTEYDEAAREMAARG
jgi:hypothetical protein